MIYYLPFINPRCISDNFCVTCATTRDKRYVIIQRRGTAQEKQTLVSAAGAAIFTGESSVSKFALVLCYVRGIKIMYFITVNYTGEYDLVIGGPPGVWHGPSAILYRSFDNLTGLGLMASGGTSNYDPLVPGKVNRCVLIGRRYQQ